MTGRKKTEKSGNREEDEGQPDIMQQKQQELKKKVRSKNIHDRPQKKTEKRKDEVTTDSTSRKRKAPENIGNEPAGRDSKLSEDHPRSKKKKDFKTSMFPRVGTTIATSEFNELRQTIIDNATKYCSDLTKRKRAKLILRVN